MEELLYDIFEAMGIDDIDVEDFLILLGEAEFMIVPIEDPTNLRYGQDD